MLNSKYPVLAIIIFILCGCSQEINQKDTNKFVGLWKLYAMEVKDSLTGEWIEWNNGNQGYLLYDDKGNMAVHITTKGYENTSYRLPYMADSLSIDALKYRARSMTYFAKYKVSEENQTVEHARISHSDPDEWNKVATRKFSFNGDTLTLFPLEETYDMLRLKWIKEPVSDKK